MKQTNIILLLLLSGAISSQTEFRFDDVLYKTMYPKDLCSFMKSNPKALLIDVRSPGEFSDTSHIHYLNIGHLKNAINIFCDSLSRYLPDLKKNLHDPIILYCSHSARSRRVSKTLHENGFTQVINLNGGMTWMNQANETDFPCKKEMIVSLLPYKSMGVEETYKFLTNNKDVVAIDVRTVAEFEGKDTVESLNIGRIKNAINIPAADIMKEESKIKPYKNKTILLYDNYGQESNQIAALLAKNGFTKVHLLLGGIGALVRKDNNHEAKKALVVNPPAFNMLNGKESFEFIQSNPGLLIIDTRSREEFSNQSKQPWKNLGNVKNARNIPAEEFSGKIATEIKNKSTPILVYGTNAAKCCKMLRETGHENVSLVYGSLWELISTYANVDGFKDKRQLLQNGEGFY